MPENQKKTPCSKLPKRNPDSKPNSDTTPTSDGQIQRPEMAANGREIEFSELTFRQQAALPTIALARSLAQAARDTGVAEHTLRRWLEDPSFRQELDRLRQESYDLARQQAQAAMPMCLSILADAALESPDPALRVRAARYLLSYGVKFVEADNLRERLKSVEDAFHSAKTASPLG